MIIYSLHLKFHFVFQVDKQQPKISAFFLKKNASKPSVLGDKSNLETSAYFSHNASPEIVVISDDEGMPCTSKALPVRNALQRSESAINILTEKKNVSPRQVSPKKDLDKIAKSQLNGELTPNQTSSIKRKLYEDESSPDVIPKTPGSERNECRNNKKHRLKLGVLKLHRQKIRGSELQRSPCKKLKYEEEENVYPEVQNRKSPLQGVTQIRMSPEAASDTMKDCVLHHEKVELKTTKTNEGCLLGRLGDEVKLDNCDGGPAESVICSGKIETLKLKSTCSVEPFNATDKLNKSISNDQFSKFKFEDNTKLIKGDNESTDEHSYGKESFQRTNREIKNVESNSETVSTTHSPTSKESKTTESCSIEQGLDKSTNISVECVKPVELLVDKSDQRKAVLVSGGQLSEKYDRKVNETRKSVNFSDTKESSNKKDLSNTNTKVALNQNYEAECSVENISIGTNRTNSLELKSSGGKKNHNVQQGLNVEDPSCGVEVVTSVDQVGTNVMESDWMKVDDWDFSAMEGECNG